MDRSSAQTLIDALEARGGIVAVVGAGGKKSTLHRLLEAHRVIGTKRIALTTTVKMAPASASETIDVIIGTADEVLKAVRSDGRSEASVLIASPSTTANRLAGMPPDVIPKIHTDGRYDVTFVKADGARMRWIKTPKDNEPLLPNGATTILPIVSAGVIGKPLSDRVAHRPEKLSMVVDAAMGTELTPEHVARLLVSEQGALQHVGNALVVPVINMVDKPETLDLARQAAAAALEATDRYERIVLASMSAASPLVEIVTR